MAEWTAIESEPGVFYELIKEFGVKGVQVEELWSLDAQSLEALRPVHGLIFLFKWTPEKDTRATATDTVGKVFFAKQVISNACATQAILSVLLNAKGLDLGPQLTQFREFTSDFPPDMKGLAIGNSDDIRLAHNSFARPEPIVSDEKGTKDIDAFHFISFLEVDGVLYELDGLKEGPIPLCTCTEGNWLDLVVPHIQERMARYTEKEVRFSLMAIVGDRLEAMLRQVRHYECLREVAAQRLEGLEGVKPSPEDGAEEGTLQAVLELPESTGELQSKLQSIEAQLTSLGVEIQEEQEKRTKWSTENVRRRHNYVPFLFNMLRFLAERGHMDGLLERTKALSQAKG